MLKLEIAGRPVNVNANPAGIAKFEAVAVPDIEMYSVTPVPIFAIVTLLEGAVRVIVAAVPVATPLVLVLFAASRPIGAVGLTVCCCANAAGIDSINATIAKNKCFNM